MKPAIRLAVGAILAFVAPRAAAAPPPPGPANAPDASADAARDDGRGTAYVVERSDNICGLDTPRQLTRPARVDYDALLAITPEIREMRSSGIDPESPRGIQLRTDAAGRVRRACERVRSHHSFCSVWKHIVRRDGKSIPDATPLVRKEILESH